MSACTMCWKKTDVEKLTLYEDDLLCDKCLGKAKKYESVR